MTFLSQAPLLTPAARRTLAFSLLLTATAPAATSALPVVGSDPRDVQIASVDFDREILEIYNFSSTAIDLSGWRFCSHDSDEVRRYTSSGGLNGVTISAGSSIFVHFGNDAPAGSANRLNRSQLGSFAQPLDGDAYGIQLFSPDPATGNVSFGNSSLIADHVQWNTAGGAAGSAAFRSGQAVSVGLWTGASDFVATDATSFRIELTDTGNGRLHGPADYRSLSGELTVQEVLVDPVGPNAGNQVFELRNDSGAAFTPMNWWICVPFAYAQLPTIEIPNGGVVRVHVGASGANSATDFFLPTLRALNAADSILVYRSNAFSTSADIVDAVTWGGATARVAQAVSVGQWSAVGDSVTLPSTEGFTIAYTGDGVGAKFWYRDASPTLGQQNPSDVRTAVGAGCPTSLGVPSLELCTPAVLGNRDFTVGVTGGPAGAPAGYQIGFVGAGLNIFGCTLFVDPLIQGAGILDAGGSGAFPLPIPDLPQLAGLTLAHQVIVVDLGAPNSIAGVSNATATEIR